MHLSIIFSCIVFVFIHFSEGQKCKTVAGIWHNELCARLELTQSADGILSGNYTIKRGTGSKTYDVTGVARVNEPNEIFSIRVISRRGAFVKGWIGQCLVCDDEETLFATWLLRRSVSNCKDEMSTNIGRNVFRRASFGESDDGKECQPAGKEALADIQDSETTRDKICSVDGHWINELKSTADLTVSGMDIRGNYVSLVPKRYEGDVYGVTVPESPESTMAMNTVWKGVASMTLWVGQCHFCGNNDETMLTSWLLWSEAASCTKVWSSVQYGQDEFARQAQKSAVKEKKEL